MFTGIIENSGKVAEVKNAERNLTYWIETELIDVLKIDQSISHDGVCLTIEDIKNRMYQITAVHETLLRTNLKFWKPGHRINLERSMLMNGRLDGHIVQGHIDDVCVCVDKKDVLGSWEFTFQFNTKYADLVIEKGSICLNGVSLTAYNVTNEQFTISVIPYTFHHTNFNMLQVNDLVNVEFDLLGKYVKRMLFLNK